MKIDDLLDLTLREILEKYRVLYNAECGFYYGVFRVDDINRIFEMYAISEDSEEVVVESIVVNDVLFHIDSDVKDYPELVKIMKNLGIPLKCLMV